MLSLAYVDLREAMQDCRGTGLVRLRYQGKVTTSFAALAERTGKVATDLGIGKRILDIDSAGGHVEAAIRAGDAIGENDWTIWVRGDSSCHSACVLLLAAGDMREVYDLMTTVPNRTLRILAPGELEQYGLAGANAVEDDLNRIRLARRCGNDFVARRDAFRRAYDARCMQPEDEAAQDVVDINACGMAASPTRNARTKARWRNSMARSSRFPIWLPSRRRSRRSRRRMRRSWNVPKRRVDSGAGIRLSNGCVPLRQVLAEAVAGAANHAQDGDHGQANQDLLHRGFRRLRVHGVTLVAPVMLATCPKPANFQQGGDAGRHRRARLIPARSA